MLSLLGIIVLVAVGVIILVLILKSNNQSDTIPDGYNGYTITSSVNEMWYYEANLTRSRNYTPPVPIDDILNPEYKNLTMRVSMMNDKTFRIKIVPQMLGNDGESVNDTERWEVPDHYFQGKAFIFFKVL